MASSDIMAHSMPNPKLHEPGVFPDPMIVPPLLEHRQSIIILHGRGSFAAKFGPPILTTKATDTGETIQTAFPHARIIFPTASRNRATIYKRSYTHQWFDNWHLEQHTERQDLMSKVLRKSVLYIHGLLRAEIELVGADSVVLWGLSQGCATTLVSLLTWDEKPFAAAVGMCGWLPFANVMLDIIQGGAGDEDDIFSHSGDDDPFASENSNLTQGASLDPAVQAVTFLREELDMADQKGKVFQSIPVFLGHGTEDQSVRIGLGWESQKSLELIGIDVRMVQYEGLGHWFSEDMFGDIFEFLKEKLKPNRLES
ncbi:hypothetical protein IFR05_006332 [Cadophora sp. M221]|nr:hypothetical protein IFR05_006332 [Cadophora sp. M221]